MQSVNLVTKIVRECQVAQSARVMQLAGMFDLPESKLSRNEWSIELPLGEKEWNIGLIVGPSGCGKSTIAKELFAGDLCSGFAWAPGTALIDGFPKNMPIKEVVGLLSSVGFSSPPSWLRPYQVLSNGEQFRATMARAMAEAGENLIVVDEFTSVVDRTVAQIGSAAIAKTVRARKQKFVALSCHYDVLEWLQPDWTYEPATAEFKWRLLRRRPEIGLEIIRVHRGAWELFRHHHYLDSSLNKTAKCFVAMVNNQPAAFTAVLSFPHAIRPGWRESRTVCLPDYQGVGIGNALGEYVAGLFRSSGKPYYSTTSHPAMITHRNKSPLWRFTAKPRLGRKIGKTGNKQFSATLALHRLTASFEFIGVPRKEDAARFALF